MKMAGKIVGHEKPLYLENDQKKQFISRKSLKKSTI